MEFVEALAPEVAVQLEEAALLEEPHEISEHESESEANHRRCANLCG